MANVETESSSYGIFERFLIWFLIPLIFTTVLLGVLLSVFDYNVMYRLLGIADQIPVVNRLVPDPQQDELLNVSVQTVNGATEQTTNTEAELEQLKEKIAEQEAELQQAGELNRKKDQIIQNLETKIAELEQQLAQKTQSSEEYESRIRQLAMTYAGMQPSKAAPIIEHLTPQERVLVLGAMNIDDRIKILEKMDPKIAAEASILMKDTVPVRDREIAALQERLQIGESANSQEAQRLSKEELGQTFAGMDPDSAAGVLVEMAKKNPGRVVMILNSVDSQARSRILSAMAAVSKETAVSITNQLVP
jgi:flagellar motility protein MotE (MotC chaperone)